MKVFASIFVFASLFLPSLAFANHDSIKMQSDEQEKEMEVQDTGEEMRDDLLLETEETLPTPETKENEQVDENEVGESSSNDPIENPKEPVLDEDVSTKVEDDNQSEEESEDVVEEGIEEIEEEEEVLETETPQFNVFSMTEDTTSLLGHLKSSAVRIYKDLEKPSNYVQAGSTYTHAVYYIKKQANYNGSLYYLISQNPSSVSGVIGWVKSTDMSTHKHVGVDRLTKTYTIKGTGSAYEKAWGGQKNIVYSNLSTFKGQAFQIHLTEKVGNNTWYRGNLNGKTVWIHEAYLEKTNEIATSRLGHIKSTSTRIYSDYKNTSKYTLAGTANTHEVYYIKKEVLHNSQRYYLISRNPSSTTGVVGWVKSNDVSTHLHVGVDKNQKTFYIKGSGSAYSKAWGGNKNLVFKSLSSYEGQVFKVNLTERVGNNTWYRGTLNGKTAWLHSNYLVEAKESTTSRLGHLKNAKVSIYQDYKKTSQFVQAGTANTNEVYYIKKQAQYGKDLYYLISRNPSSTTGVVGWVKANDLSTHTHVGVDKKKKTYYIKGPGDAFTKAWGGSKNKTISNLNTIKGERFEVNLTEKVGNNVWYRGVVKGKNVWIHNSFISTTPLKVINTTHTNYNLTLDRMIDIQYASVPQTDKRYPLWIREDAFEKGSISNNQGIISKGANWNLRREPTTKSATGGQVAGGTKLTIYGSVKGKDDANYTWYHVRNTSGWVQPDKVDLGYYVDPSKFTSFKDSLQFLKLSQSANIDVAEVNAKVLKGRGILNDQAKTFVDAGKAHGVNEIYLIAHALLETGNGTSTLAKGVKYKGKTVYNMYGIGARDACPIECGTEYAYNAGWFTPEQAIIGGAKFIGNGYVQAGQDTLYKMRWNPSFAAGNGYASHQYATDIGWAFKQTSKMNELYGLLGSYRITLDIPKYK